jgi:hypothetical protein
MSSAGLVRSAALVALVALAALAVLGFSRPGNERPPNSENAAPLQPVRQSPRVEVSSADGDDSEQPSAGTSRQEAVGQPAPAKEGHLPEWFDADVEILPQRLTDLERARVMSYVDSMEAAAAADVRQHMNVVDAPSMHAAAKSLRRQELWRAVAQAIAHGDYWIFVPREMRTIRPPPGVVEQMLPAVVDGRQVTLFFALDTAVHVGLRDARRYEDDMRWFVLTEAARIFNSRTDAERRWLWGEWKRAQAGPAAPPPHLAAQFPEGVIVHEQNVIMTLPPRR